MTYCEHCSSRSIQTSKEIVRTRTCKVEEKIKEYFLGIKKVTDMIKRTKSSDFFGIKSLCQCNIEKMSAIQTLCLVLFPEYDYVEIDNASLNAFLDTDSTYVKVYFHKIVPNTKDYTFFKIVKEEK